MTEQASDLEESVKADVFLMGSFQYTEEAMYNNDHANGLV